MLRIFFLIYLTATFWSYECFARPELASENGNVISKNKVEDLENEILKRLMTKLFPNFTTIQEIETLREAMGNRSIIDLLPPKALEEAKNNFRRDNDEDGSGVFFQNSKIFDEWFNNVMSFFSTEVLQDPIDFENDMKIPGTESSVFVDKV